MLMLSFILMDFNDNILRLKHEGGSAKQKKNCCLQNLQNDYITDLAIIGHRVLPYKKVRILL